jgi:phospholipase A1
MPKTVVKVFEVAPVLSLLLAAMQPSIGWAAGKADVKRATVLEAGECLSISDDAARLACYDRRFNRSSTPTPETPIPGSGAQQAEADGIKPPASSPQPVRTQATASAAAAEAVTAQGKEEARKPTPLSQFWELEKPDKRGTFRVLTYRPNYVLPLIVSDRVNRQPVTPTHAAPGVLPDYKHLEAMIQVSLRVKLAEELLLPGADLWFAYTHRAQWQVWTGEESRPFRNTDYEPELIYVMPVPESVRALPGGWRWRMVNLGVAHQSNGQTDPLSRSWNRFSIGTAVEKGDFNLEAQLFRRMREKHRDDNPDLTDYIGRAEIRASWLPGRAITSLAWRPTLHDWDRGSLQLDWSYPVSSDQPQGLRWYLRAFQGYGDSLLDYNFRKTSLGAGVTLFAF